MKKILLLVLCAILALSFVGCDSDEKSDALLEYMNEDMNEIAELEDAFNAIYNSDACTYESLSTEGAEAFKKFSEKATEVANGIEDEKIKDVHKIYVSYVEKKGAALEALTEYYKDNTFEDAKVDEANKCLDEAEELFDKYDLELKTLMSEYGVEYKD